MADYDDMIEGYLKRAADADAEADKFCRNQFLVCEGAMREVAKLHRLVVKQLQEKRELGA